VSFSLILTYFRNNNYILTNENVVQVLQCCQFGMSPLVGINLKFMGF